MITKSSAVTPMPMIEQSQSSLTLGGEMSLPTALKWMPFISQLVTG